MTTILVTNDDGLSSPGLWALYESLGELGELLVVAPESPRSATGMSLTFHKPLRISKVQRRGRHAYVVSGNTADCVFLGLIEVLKGRLPSLVASGINLGDNVTAQNLFASGTVAGAIQGAVMGIPSLAFSLTVPEDRPMKREDLGSKLSMAGLHARRIVKGVLKKGLPKGTDYLNVNFPFEVAERTPIRVTTLGLRKYDDQVVRREDPRGRPYFWQWGKMKGGTEFEDGTDVHAVHVEHAISITPLRLDASIPVRLEELGTLLESVESQRS